MLETSVIPLVFQLVLQLCNDGVTMSDGSCVKVNQHYVSMYDGIFVDVHTRFAI